LIAHVSAIFLLPVFELSVIFNDFRASTHSISAREGGNTVCWKAIARKRTVDDSVTYWFPWKHHMARRRGLEFGIFDQTPPTGLAARSSFLHKTTIAKASDRLGPLGLAIRLFRRLCTKTQPKCGLAFGASQMHQAPIFRPFDVRLGVSDMLRSFPTMPSVITLASEQWDCCSQLLYTLHSEFTLVKNIVLVFVTSNHFVVCVAFVCSLRYSVMSPSAEVSTDDIHLVAETRRQLRLIFNRMSNQIKSQFLTWLE